MIEKRTIFRFVLLWLAGIDLRLTLLAVPPVLPLIHRDLALDETTVAVSYVTSDGIGTHAASRKPSRMIA